MVIYSFLVVLCFINSVVSHAVLTCAVSACSSISSNSWYSSSSGSAPESRAALAIKYGGSSPMAVPAPWEKNNPDLFSCLFPNTKHVTHTHPVDILRADETSCLEQFAFIHQVRIPIISNRMLLPLNPYFPFFPCAGESLGVAGSGRHDLCIPGAPWSGAWPEPWEAGAGGPAVPRIPIPHILSQHCCVSPHHMMPDTFPSM